MRAGQLAAGLVIMIESSACTLLAQLCRHPCNCEAKVFARRPLPPTHPPLTTPTPCRICPGHQTNQDAVVSRGMLRPLCAYLQAPLGLRGAVGEAAREAILGIK